MTQGSGRPAPAACRWRGLGDPYRLGMPDARSGHHLEPVVLYWSLLFLFVAIAAGLLGFSGVAAGAAVIAQVLFVAFLLLFLFLLAFGLAARRRRA